MDDFELLTAFCDITRNWPQKNIAKIYRIFSLIKELCKNKQEQSMSKTWHVRMQLLKERDQISVRKSAFNFQINFFC
mgnify:FL=1